MVSDLNAFDTIDLKIMSGFGQKYLLCVLSKGKMLNHDIFLFASYKHSFPVCFTAFFAMALEKHLNGDVLLYVYMNV